MIYRAIGAFFFITLFGIFPAIVLYSITSPVPMGMVDFSDLLLYGMVFLRFVLPFTGIMGLFAAISLLVVKKIHPIALLVGLIVVYFAVQFITDNPLDIFSGRNRIFSFLLPVYCTIVIGWVAKQLFDKAGREDGLRLSHPQMTFEALSALYIIMLAVTLVASIAKSLVLTWMIRLDIPDFAYPFYTYIIQQIQPFFCTVLAFGLILYELNKKGFVLYRSFTRKMLIISFVLSGLFSVLTFTMFRLQTRVPIDLTQLAASLFGNVIQYFAYLTLYVFLGFWLGSKWVQR